MSSRRAPVVALAVSAVVALSALAAAPVKSVTPVAVVFLAPNYPGTTEEAQPRMDGLARSLAELSGRPSGSLTASYVNQEKMGLAQVADGGVGVLLAPMPLYLAHRAELDLTPRLLVVQQGLKATQAWALVAKKGAIATARDLGGVTVFSTAGYSPRFVTAVALAGFGDIPPSVKVTTGTQVLSALRKVAKDPTMAAVLDEEQTRALSTLPFAGELEVVYTGPAVPVAVVATVGKALTEAQWKPLGKAFVELHGAAPGKAALEGVRLERFVPLDEAAVAEARTRFEAER